MTLRTTFILLFVGLALLLAGIVYLSGELRDSQEAMAAAGARRYESYRLADRLRQSSDDLTRMARTYTVTGDERYETWFREILAIRNGKRAEPPGYGGIYWDFVCAEEPPKGKAGRKMALRHRMVEAGFTRQELTKLRESQSRSDALVRLENVAMNAMKGRFEDESGGFTREAEPDPETARDLLHGEAYHEAKAAIMRPIEAFFALLDARTAGDVAAVTARSESLARSVWIVALLAAACLVFAGVVVHRRVIRPVRNVAEQLQDIAEGDGDLTRRVAEGGNDEVGALSRSFNVFVTRVHDVVAQTMQATRLVETATVQIASSSKEQEAGAAELGRVSSDVAAATQRIVSTADALVGTMGDVARSADTSAELAATGRTGLQSLDQTMSRFLVGTEVARTKLMAIEKRTHAIDQVVTTMTTVADQTNLLSMNAAIEAEKAGKHGYGFLVVAEEIRRMADQTAAATLTIEESVAAMHGAVAEGVSEMAGLAEEILSGTRATAKVGMQLGEILDEVQGLRGRFGAVNEGMLSQSEGAHGIGESMAGLQESATETAAALRDLGGSSDSLREAVNALGEQIGRFKV